MTTLATRPAPNGRARPTLADQLDRLDRILDGLADALNQSVTTTVSAAVGKAVQEMVATVTRELAARPVPTTAGISEPEVVPKRGLSAGWLAQSPAASLRLFAAAGRLAGRSLRRLGAPLVGSARRTTRAPGRLVVLVFAGVAAGTGAGFGGPLVGAAVGVLAGFAMFGATSPV